MKEEQLSKASNDIDSELLPGTRPPPAAPTSKSRHTMQFGFEDTGDDDEEDE